jgi:uncharacterized protein
MWRRLDNQGHDWASLSSLGSSPVLRGTAVFIEDRIPSRLDYKIVCSPRWKTLSVLVLGWVEDRKIDLRIERSTAGAWRLNGKSVPGVKGCLDADLSFSPSTNLLPIRRLNLEIGQEAQVRAAWLTFPDFGLRPLIQWFRKESQDSYFYRSDTGFSTVLRVNSDGFVVDYPPLWTEEKGAVANQ